MTVIATRAPSRCGCSDHCTTHEAARPVHEIDCLEAAVSRLRMTTYGIERFYAELANPHDAHPDWIAQVRATLRQELADLAVVSALVDAYGRARLPDPINVATDPDAVEPILDRGTLPRERGA